MNTLFQAGKAYYIQQEQMYYVGIVDQIVDGKWLKMRNASWVIWTGNVDESLGKMTFRNNSKTVKTGYVGEWIVHIDHIMALKEWPVGEVPTSSLRLPPK